MKRCAVYVLVTMLLISSSFSKPLHHPTNIKIEGAIDLPLKDGKLWCTTCHSKHFTAPKKKQLVPSLFAEKTPRFYLRKKGNELCKTCHEKESDENISHKDFSDQSCSTCHKMHNGEVKLLSSLKSSMCTNCHADKRKSIHTIPMVTSSKNGIILDGKQLTCQTCHNPHENKSGKFIRKKSGKIKKMCIMCHGNGATNKLFKNFHKLLK